MKKFMAILLATVMLLAVAAGCTGNDTTTSTTSAANSTTSANTATTSADTTEKMSGQISVISREDGSGTRVAFVELLGIEQKDEAGNKVDRTSEDAAISNSTSVVMTSVAGNKQAIGYISLGSLNDTVKAIAVDGVEATVENIVNETYKVSRPFNIATKGEISESAQDFINFIMSDDGQKVVEEEGYIRVSDAAAYAGSYQGEKIVVAGSSSVTPVMEKLKEAYIAINPDAEIEIQMTDSSAGVASVIDGSCDIGMASRALKDSELENGVTPTVIAMDGIAVIVNVENPVDSLTSDQICSIYTGEYTDWSEVA